MSLNFGQSLFPPAGELIKSYDYIDTLTGQGYITFYLANARDSSAIAINLLAINNQTRGESTTTSYTATDETEVWIKSGDVDWDYEVNVPMNMKGKTYVPYVWNGVAPSSASKAYMIIKLRKYDGTTETDIGSSKTSEKTSLHGGGRNMTELGEIDITSTVHFKKGDILRITVEVWTWCFNSGGGGSVTATYYHDPVSRVMLDADSATYNSGISTAFKVQAPFKLDV